MNDCLNLAERLVRAFNDAPLFGDQTIVLRVDGEIHRLAQQIVHEAGLKKPTKSEIFSRVYLEI